jgi:hypothetical protein
MYETSGVLRPAVEAYLLTKEELSAEHIAALRAYFRQWVMDSVWDTNPHANEFERACLAQLRVEVDGLTSRAAIARWLPKAEAFGIDPL